jgi:hypothetical protein
MARRPNGLRAGAVLGSTLAVATLLLSGSLGPVLSETSGTLGTSVGIAAFPSDTPQTPGFPAAQAGDLIERSFEWRHAGQTWRLDATGDLRLLDDYAARDRLTFSHDYKAYALDSAGAEWVAGLAHDLDTLYAAGGIPEGVERLQAILAFVQHLPYGLDIDTAGHPEWPRYPMETIFAEANDCEDTSVLYANILRALGHDAILINPPRHMAVGVALDDHEGVYVEHDGKHYYYAETTGMNWRIGVVPPIFSEGPFRPLSLHPQPILARPTIETITTGRTVEAVITVQNVGNLVATDVTIGATFQAISGNTWADNSCEPVHLEGESSIQCTVLLKAPPDSQDMRLSAWARSPDTPNRFTHHEWPLV